MFGTTLRISEDLAGFLQEAARAEALSVNTFLVRLLERERQAVWKRKLAQDWEAYGAEQAAQEVEYALEAQGEIAAEGSQPYRVAPKGPRGKGT